MQEQLNFTLLFSETLPQKWELISTSQSFRDERSPYNLQDEKTRKPWSIWGGIHNCSYRFELMHTSGKRVRCKQFLYDLGPFSAADHAILYDHYAWKISPEISGDLVYWHGFDDIANPVLTFQTFGTNVDLRVLQGEVHKEELSAIASSLKSSPQACHIARSPFAERSYWSRYPRYDQNLYMQGSSYKIPSSLWKLRWPSWEAEHEWMQCDSSLISQDLKQYLSTLCEADFLPDSLCVFGDKHNPLEVQLYLIHKENPNMFAWLRRIKAQASTLKQPSPDRLPELDVFSGYSSFIVNVHEPSPYETPLYLASVTPEVGPHDLIWWHQGYLYLIQICAAPSFGLKEALLLSSSLCGQKG